MGRTRRDTVCPQFRWGVWVGPSVHAMEPYYTRLQRGLRLVAESHDVRPMPFLCLALVDGTTWTDDETPDDVAQRLECRVFAPSSGSDGGGTSMTDNERIIKDDPLSVALANFPSGYRKMMHLRALLHHENIAHYVTMRDAELEDTRVSVFQRMLTYILKPPTRPVRFYTLYVDFVRTCAAPFMQFSMNRHNTAATVSSMSVSGKGTRQSPPDRANMVRAHVASLSASSSSSKNHGVRQQRKTSTSTSTQTTTTKTISKARRVRPVVTTLPLKNVKKEHTLASPPILSPVHEETLTARDSKSDDEDDVGGSTDAMWSLEADVADVPTISSSSSSSSTSVSS